MGPRNAHGGSVARGLRQLPLTSRDDARVAELTDLRAEAELGEDRIGVLTERRGIAGQRRRRRAELRGMAGQARLPDDVMVVELEQSAATACGSSGSSAGERIIANGTRSASKRALASAMLRDSACA